MEKTVTTTTRETIQIWYRTESTPRIDYESKGDRVVSVDILPFVVQKMSNLLDRFSNQESKLYAFFDNIDVTSIHYTRPPL